MRLGAYSGVQNFLLILIANVDFQLTITAQLGHHTRKHKNITKAAQPLYTAVISMMAV